MFKNFFVKKINGLALLLIGIFVLILSFKASGSSEGKIALSVIGYGFTALGLFNAIYSNRRLLWMRQDFLDMFVRVTVYVSLALFAFLGLLSMSGV